MTSSHAHPSSMRTTREGDEWRGRFADAQWRIDAGTEDLRLAVLAFSVFPVSEVIDAVGASPDLDRIISITTAALTELRAKLDVLEADLAVLRGDVPQPEAVAVTLRKRASTKRRIAALERMLVAWESVSTDDSMHEALYDLACAVLDHQESFGDEDGDDEDRALWKALDTITVAVNGETVSLRSAVAVWDEEDN